MSYELKNNKSIFFDYDGCINDSLSIYSHAFRKAQQYLISLGLAEKRFWLDDEIRQWIGDRQLDIEAGKVKKMFTIGARYGFPPTRRLSLLIILRRSSGTGRSGLSL